MCVAIRYFVLKLCSLHLYSTALSDKRSVYEILMPGTKYLVLITIQSVVLTADVFLFFTSKYLKTEKHKQFTHRSPRGSYYFFFNRARLITQLRKLSTRYQPLTVELTADVFVRGIYMYIIYTCTRYQIRLVSMECFWRTRPTPQVCPLAA